jgi:spore maturation protein CgeB
VHWIGHVSTNDHNRLNCSAGMVMNINRNSMADFGFSPPTRVFEVSGAGTCMLCDDWPGIDDCFQPDKEILVVRTAEDVVKALNQHDTEARSAIGRAFRARALRDHTYEQRALQVENAFLNCMRASHSKNTEPLREIA